MVPHDSKSDLHLRMKRNTLQRLEAEHEHEKELLRQEISLQEAILEPGKKREKNELKEKHQKGQIVSGSLPGAVQCGSSGHGGHGGGQDGHDGQSGQGELGLNGHSDLSSSICQNSEIRKKVVLSQPQNSNF